MGIPDIFESDRLWSCTLDFITKVKIGKGRISDDEVPLKSKFTKNVI